MRCVDETGVIMLDNTVVIPCCCKYGYRATVSQCGLQVIGCRPHARCLGVIVYTGKVGTCGTVSQQILLVCKL